MEISLNFMKLLRICMSILSFEQTKIRHEILALMMRFCDEFLQTNSATGQPLAAKTGLFSGRVGRVEWVHFGRGRWRQLM